MLPTTAAPRSTPASAPRLLDRVRDKIRLKHYSLRTEQAYLDWIRRFILHHGKRHPDEMGATEVEAFLTHLAVAGKVAASTQNQAKSALLFLYREVLETMLPAVSAAPLQEHLARGVNGDGSTRSRPPGWPSRRRRIPCAIPSPRICWSPATTSARCRSCSAIRMFRRR